MLLGDLTSKSRERRYFQSSKLLLFLLLMNVFVYKLQMWRLDKNHDEDLFLFVIGKLHNDCDSCVQKPILQVDL
jgi:hypothetical protein